MNAEKMDNLWEKYIAIADIAEYQKKYLKTLGKLLMQEICKRSISWCLSAQLYSMG